MGVAPHYAGVGTTQKCGRGSGGRVLGPACHFDET